MYFVKRNKFNMVKKEFEEFGKQRKISRVKTGD